MIDSKIIKRDLLLSFKFHKAGMKMAINENSSSGRVHHKSGFLFIRNMWNLVKELEAK